MVPDALSTAVASFIGVHNNSKQEKGKKKKRRKEWPNLLIGVLVVERAGSLVAETASLVKRVSPGASPASLLSESWGCFSQDCPGPAHAPGVPSLATGGLQPDTDPKGQRVPHPPGCLATHHNATCHLTTPVPHSPETSPETGGASQERSSPLGNVWEQSATCCSWGISWWEAGQSWFSEGKTRTNS